MIRYNFGTLQLLVRGIDEIFLETAYPVTHMKARIRVVWLSSGEIARCRNQLPRATFNICATVNLLLLSHLPWNRLTEGMCPLMEDDTDRPTRFGNEEQSRSNILDKPRDEVEVLDIIPRTIA